MGRYHDDDDDYRYGYGYGYRPYVPVAQRRAQAAKEIAKLAKQGQEILPIRIEGRAIASTFWGKAWCTNLEGYSDFSNRLPRGRTYVRNGSVVHLKVVKGQIEALVSGSDLYKVRIDIDPLPRSNWTALKARCAGKIGTLVELLQGKLSKAVMEIVTDRDRGLFPKPREIKMHCSCPDGAVMCKHVAAVMYGVGNRLDSAPELLFSLRGVDHGELIEQAIPKAPARAKGDVHTIAPDDLGAIFNIEIDEPPVAAPVAKVGQKSAPKKAVKKARAPVKKAAAAKSAPKTAAPAKASAKTPMKASAPKKKSPAKNGRKAPATTKKRSAGKN